jgi:hypothetical protein
MVCFLLFFASPARLPVAKAEGKMNIESHPFNAAVASSYAQQGCKEFHEKGLAAIRGISRVSAFSCLYGGKLQRASQ